MTTIARLTTNALALLAVWLAAFPAQPARAADTFGSISGNVYVQASGSAGPSGRGLPDVEVTLSLNGKTDSRRTGSEGTFSFGELLPGRYRVSVAIPSGYRATGDASRYVVVDSRAAVGGIDFALTPFSTPTGTPERTLGNEPAASSMPVAGRDSPLGSVAARPTPPPLFGQAAVRAAQASPSPAGSAQPTRTATPAGTPGPAVRPTPTSLWSDDILIGRGLHWRSTGDGVVLAFAPDPRVNPSADAQPTRPSVTSFESLRRAAGLVGLSELRAWADEASMWLGVPFKTQIDGTQFSLVNCGPASLAMVLAAFGMDLPPAFVRDYMNFLTDDYDADDGTSLDALSRVAREAGLKTFGLYGRGGYRDWTVDDVREHIRAGHPVVTLVKYRSLPGNGGSLAEWDHYIVVTGLTGDDLIYTDSAFANDYGFSLLISPADLERAWTFASIRNHAVAIGLGDTLKPLPNVPPRLMAASLAAAPVEEAPSPSLAMIAGPSAQWLRERMLAEVGARSAAAPDDSPLAARPEVPTTALAPSAPQSRPAGLFLSEPVEAAAHERAMPDTVAGATSPGSPTPIGAYAVLLLVLAGTVRRQLGTRRVRIHSRRGAACCAETMAPVVRVEQAPPIA